MVSTLNRTGPFHWAASSIKAVESAPPDTASARCRNPLSGENSLSTSASPNSAPGFFGLISSPLARLHRFWKLCIDGGEGRACLVFLPELAQRHAEFQQAVRGFAVLRIGLVAGEKRLRRGLVVGLNVIGLAKPELGVACKFVIGVLLNERSESSFRFAIAPPQQAFVGELIKLLRRIGGRCGVIEGRRLHLLRHHRLARIGWLGAKLQAARCRVGQRAGRWPRKRAKRLGPRRLLQSARDLFRAGALIEIAGLIRLKIVSFIHAFDAVLAARLAGQRVRAAGLRGLSALARPAMNLLHLLLELHR